MAQMKRDGSAAEVQIEASIVPGFRAAFASETQESAIPNEMFSARESEHLSNLIADRRIVVARSNPAVANRFTCTHIAFNRDVRFCAARRRGDTATDTAEALEFVSRV
jgi:hypothetical protein